MVPRGEKVSDTFAKLGALPAFGRLWKGYARQVLVDLSAALTTALR